jgi:3-phosphoshikimate 1-carboxyvinyltransferase
VSGQLSREGSDQRHAGEAGSSVTVRQVGQNPSRTGFLDLLKRMGAMIQAKSSDPARWEPLGEVMLTYAPLKAIQIDPPMIPCVIDELPILMVAATQARGVTLIRGAGELRVKEADRIVSMVRGLSAMGARIQAQGEEIRIEGPTPLKGASVKSFNDHRTAMALAVAGLAAQGITTLEGSEWIDISFPGFIESLESIRR